MRWSLLFAGLLMLIAGTVWIVQGAGALHGSFMTGSPTWLWIGIATDLVGIGLCVRAFRGFRPRSTGKRASGPPG